MEDVDRRGVDPPDGWHEVEALPHELVAYGADDGSRRAAITVHREILTVADCGAEYRVVPTSQRVAEALMSKARPTTVTCDGQGCDASVLAAGTKELEALGWTVTYLGDAHLGDFCPSHPKLGGLARKRGT